MMELLRQGKDDEACALHSVAMSTGKPLASVIAAAGGHYGRMSVTQIETLLDVLGYGTNPYDAQGSLLPGRGILILYKKDMSDGHAVAYEDGVIYDCDNPIQFHGITEILFMYNRGEVGEGEWFASKVMPVFPLKTREFAVGKKEEA